MRTMINLTDDRRADMSKTTITAQQFRDRLADVRTLDDLQTWAADLYESGLLDESEQAGDLAPWAVPDEAAVIYEAQEDIYILLPSGELARWCNRDRAWGKVVSEDDIPGRYRVRVIIDVSDRCIGALGRLLYASDMLAAACKEADSLSGDYYYGVAIVDDESKTIDWGDEVTDYWGDPLDE